LTAALLQFAVARFALSKPYKKTGKTRLQVLLDIQAQTGITAGELTNLPPMPETLGYIWEWFLDAHRKRQAGFSMNALSWSDAQAFFQLRRLRPSPWELDAFLQLDESQSSEATSTAGSAKDVGNFLNSRKEKANE